MEIASSNFNERSACRTGSGGRSGAEQAVFIPRSPAAIVSKDRMERTRVTPHRMEARTERGRVRPGTSVGDPFVLTGDVDFTSQQL